MSQSDNSVFVIYREGSFSVEDISRKLKIQPNSMSAGDENGKNSVWKLLCSNKSLPLEDQIMSWISLLESKTNVLKELKNEGWFIELDCLIQPDEGAAIVSLESKLLLQASNLHANLTIRIWE